jgi:hypothetical protein
MPKIKFLILAVFISSCLHAQDSTNAEKRANRAPSNLSFTSRHRSISVTYAVSSFFDAAPFNTGSSALSTKGSFTIGPIAVQYNQALSDHINISIGPVLMLHRDTYTYENQGPHNNGASDLILGGGTVGFNYHFLTTCNVDPYIGVSGGVGRFWGRGGADQLGLRLKGSTVALYGAAVGVSFYNKRNNAFIIEAGYDYLSYVKVGYSFARRK